MNAYAKSAFLVIFIFLVFLTFPKLTFADWCSNNNAPQGTSCGGANFCSGGNVVNDWGYCDTSSGISTCFITEPAKVHTTCTVPAPFPQCGASANACVNNPAGIASDHTVFVTPIAGCSSGSCTATYNCDDLGARCGECGNPACPTPTPAPATCPTSCSACPTIITCGQSTYDTCTPACSGSTAIYNCQASGNANCIGTITCSSETRCAPTPSCSGPGQIGTTCTVNPPGSQCPLQYQWCNGGCCQYTGCPTTSPYNGVSCTVQPPGSQCAADYQWCYDSCCRYTGATPTPTPTPTLIPVPIPSPTPTPAPICTPGVKRLVPGTCTTTCAL